MLESGQWGLAKCRLISLAEALQLGETEAVGNFCHAHHVKMGVAQLTADFLQPTQQHILGRAHAEKLGTARAKGLIADCDQRAQFGHLQRPAKMFRQDLLEPDHDSGMAALGVPVGPGTGGCQTGHQGLDQTLFNGAGDLGMGQYLGFCLGEATYAWRTARKHRASDLTGRPRTRTQAQAAALRDGVGRDLSARARGFGCRVRRPAMARRFQGCAGPQPIDQGPAVADRPPLFDTGQSVPQRQQPLAAERRSVQFRFLRDRNLAAIDGGGVSRQSVIPSLPIM